MKLGGRMLLMQVWYLMRVWILVGGMVVVPVGVIVVAASGVISFSEKWCVLVRDGG